jgi:hypothetical protein
VKIRGKTYQKNIMRYFIYFSVFSLIVFLYFKNDLFLDGTNRPTVTFIVGEDAEQENRYFSAAKKYYSTHDVGNQSIVVDSCTSLVAIQQFLKTHPTANNKPWGTINIVAHGNEWTGMKLAIVPNGKGRVNTATLENAMENDVLPSLRWCRKIDRLTELHIQGCGVGKDVALLAAMKTAFGGRLSVFSPEQFVLYQADNRCYLADFFYSFQHPDSSFNKQNAVQELTKRYPKTALDWTHILDKDSGETPKSPFVYRFKIPIRWTVNFPDSLQVPKFPNPNNLQFEDWLFQQKPLMASLDKTNLPKEAFRWVYDTDATSMKIYGVCQVVCVLNPDKKVAL